MSERRLEVNAEPLKIVSAKAGDKAPEPEYLFAQRRRRGKLVAASIHRAGCKVAPQDNHVLSDRSHWEVKTIPKSEVNACNAYADERGVKLKVWCRSCGGWSVA